MSHSFFKIFPNRNSNSCRTLLTLLMLLVTFSTVYDFLDKKPEKGKKSNLNFFNFSTYFSGKLCQFFASFSVTTNAKELFDTKRNKSANNVGYLTGIKALSYFGIIFIHSVSSRFWFPLRDQRRTEKFLQSPMAAFVEGFGYNVDTFLLVSGFLITRSMLKEMKRFEVL